jgi:hypothetical protein
MTGKKHIAFFLIVLALMALEAASHPGAFLAIGAPLARAADWIADHIGHIPQRPTQCPWNPECI